MIYLLGGSGYVGQAYQALLSRKGLSFKSLSRAEADYADPTVLRELLRRDKPEFLINAAGYTGKPNVDACEIHKAECLLGNAVLPGMIAKACAEAGVPWGHVSSGCIYNGARSDGKGFTEEDQPNFTFRAGPCSFYSGTKALGEEVLAGQPNLYIWRLRIPFDNVDNPRNYLSKLMRYERLLEAVERADAIAAEAGYGMTGVDCLMRALLSESAGPVRTLLDASKPAEACLKDVRAFEERFKRGATGWVVLAVHTAIRWADTVTWKSIRPSGRIAIRASIAFLKAPTRSIA